MENKFHVSDENVLQLAFPLISQLAKLNRGSRIKSVVAFLCVLCSYHSKIGEQSAIECLEDLMASSIATLENNPESVFMFADDQTPLQ